jgi:alpha-N-arabinofuranosidase
MKPLVSQQRAAMDAWDPARKIGLIVDEWGTWHPVEDGTNPAFLYQQNTIRDAIVAANTLDIFNRHADKVVMANIAQTINVLQAMILTEGEQMLVTPTGYVYEMYAPHQGAMALRTRIETPDINFRKSNILQTSWQSALQKDETMEGSIPLIAGSASLKGKELFLTMTNSHAQEAGEVTTDILGGAKINMARGQILAGEIHAHNTFSSPSVATPQVLDVSCESFRLSLTLPPASVAAIQIQLG